MLKPIGARLLVKRIDAPKLESSTIIIPETVGEGDKSSFAVVLAVGSKVSAPISVADTVLLSKYCGAPVTVELDGERLDADIVMEDDVLGILKEN